MIVTPNEALLKSHIGKGGVSLRNSDGAGQIFLSLCLFMVLQSDGSKGLSRSGTDVYDMTTQVWCVGNAFSLSPAGGFSSRAWGRALHFGIQISLVENFNALSCECEN